MIKLLPLLLNLFFLSIIYKKYAYAKEFTIRNIESDFDNLPNIINNNQNDNELILNYVDDYYYTTMSYERYEISVETNITFRGNKNGTIYDFHHERNREFWIQFPSEKGKTVIFENFIFRNYYANYEMGGLHMFIVMAFTDNFKILFNNCTFEDNNYAIFRAVIHNLKPTHTDPSIVFNKCKFM